MMYGKYSCNELKILFQRVVSVVPTLGTDNTNGWYKEYQSVVQGIPTVGTESTAPGNILRPAGLCLLRQYLVSVFGNKDHAFPLGGRQAVVCAYCPAVGFVNENIVSAHVDHRFDGERHSRYYQHARTTLAEVFHIRLFMELDAYAMSAEVAHYTVTVLLGVFLNGGADVAQSCPRPGSLYAEVATFFGYLYEALHLQAYLSDHIHARGVGEISFIYGRYIYVDNISAAQKFFGAGDAMAHYVIDADAYAFWEPLVQERGGNGIMVCREAIYHVVYFCGRHPFANIL